MKRDGGTRGKRSRSIRGPELARSNARIQFLRSFNHFECARLPSSFLFLLFAFISRLSRSIPGLSLALRYLREQSTIFSLSPLPTPLRVLSFPFPLWVPRFFLSDRLLSPPPLDRSGSRSSLTRPKNKFKESSCSRGVFTLASHAEFGIF